MAYSTLTDLQNAVEATLLIQLTDDEALGAVNTARINRAISAADATIDGHVRAHYNVPLSSPVPGLITKLSVDLSLFELYCRRASAFEMPDWIKRKHDDSMKMLVALRKGELDLGIEPPATESTAEIAGYYSYDGDDNNFTPSSLEEF